MILRVSRETRRRSESRFKVSGDTELGIRGRLDELSLNNGIRGPGRVMAQEDSWGDVDLWPKLALWSLWV